MIPDGSDPYERYQRARLLKQFIQDSWVEETGQFQTRDYQSHLSNDSFPLPGPLHGGWNAINRSLPHPSRLALKMPRPAAGDYQPGPLATFHGRDYKDRYRIEELHGKDFHWQKNHGWGTTRSIFSRIDHYVLADEIQSHHVFIQAPRSAKGDLSLIFPLWMEGLPKEIGESLVNRTLSDPAYFWSDYGLRSFPGLDQGLISLPLNLIVTQGLIRHGFTTQAREIFFGWVKAASINLLEKGSLYSSWDGRTGVGVGKVNQVEGCLPIGLLLDLLQVRIAGIKELILEANSPILFPFQLFYRGVEITLKENETRVVRPGGEEILYPRGEEAVIHL
jgi:hypothetical protein